MADTPASLKSVQLAFSAHLRDPAGHPAPAGIEARRLKIYRDLFYNTVEGLIARAFPVLRSISSDAAWHARVRDFYARHRCQTPLFHEVAKEFVEFLENGRGEHADDPPFLLELAHYEWVEAALLVDEAALSPHLADPNGDLMAAPPVVSPLAWPLAYTWPVHRIVRDHQPATPPPSPTYLVVCRDRLDKVRFLEINAVSARLLQLIDEQPASSGTALMRQIAGEMSHPDPAAVVADGRALLDHLHQNAVILGTRRTSAG